MNIFDKFFTKFAYKFDKGYPDMNNEQDISLLESLVSEVLGEDIKLNELTVSPKYQSKGVFNPFYVIDSEVDLQVKTLLKDKKISSVLVGPGNGVSDETKSRTLMALAFVDHVVIDADAITSFEGSSDELFIDTYEHTILTPHEGEFTRLFGPEVNKIEDKIFPVNEIFNLDLNYQAKSVILCQIDFLTAGFMEVSKVNLCVARIKENEF